MIRLTAAIHGSNLSNVSDSTPLNFDVVIAGGGFAGVDCARALAREFGDAAVNHVALISEHNFMTFQPMLAEVVGSTVSPRHVVNPIRRLCPRTTVLRGSITAIDLEAGVLRMTGGDFAPAIDVRFQHLFMALGGIVDVSRVPGMAEHAYILKNVGDALLLRAAIIDRFEEANLQSDLDERKRSLTFVVVGGGYSGVETAGQILDLAQEMMHSYPRIDADCVRVVLVHSGQHLLPEISESLGIYCEDNLRARGVELILNTRVAAVTARRAKLNDGREIESHTVVCTIGNAPHPLLTSLCQRHNLGCEKGRIITDSHLRVLGQPRLWAAGDCAAVPMWSGDAPSPDRTSTLSAYEARTFCPPTAQFATRQAQVAAKNIASVLRNPAAALTPFKFTGLGELAAIGHHAAVAEIMGMKFSGFIAWWMWRTIYLMKLPGLERKVRVALDWTLDLFFPRDIALFQSRPTRLLADMHLEKGDELFKAGDPARSIYVLKSGRIELLDENRQVLRTLTAGDQIGKNTILAKTGWRFTAVAAEPTRVVNVSARIFEEVASTGASSESVFSRPVESPLEDEAATPAAR
jgi:NADH dehydrogenase